MKTQHLKPLFKKEFEFVGVFDTLKETLNGIFAVSGDVWVRRKNISSLDIEI